MVNYNGHFFSSDEPIFTHGNRGYKYGDGVFETLRVVNGDIFFWEDHYFRLMASMRMLRMEIPMNFTLEHLQEEILNTAQKNNLDEGLARVRFTVARNEGGLYTPDNNSISYTIEASQLSAPFYTLRDEVYEVELFKDYYVNKDLLSQLKTTNKLLNVLAGVYAKENGYDNCILLNTDKQVIEAVNGNVFLVHGNTIKTAPLEDGCLNGIIRKKIMEIIEASEEFELSETSISPFELQKADEFFVTNSISGIIPITKYRKKTYTNTVARNLLGKLNAKARLELTS
ncbi:aminotransferase class IV [Flagellimonas meridianipacifica]|uniref:branched-chain-amino-acid transaminase n=1 Tax=Flagellimonas meridianipacifica TaxID=1080225 RepID=A0A2T0MCJ0_9FLAO|nr:aminotransferase class IV [Allomuricauda pacifica]PRX55214.1 branched-chain amino acid aminotransferase [Allomuricauda pacifica]